MTNYTHDPRYDELPETIKWQWTPKEFAWLSDGEKDNLVNQSCMPEHYEDD